MIQSLINLFTLGGNSTLLIGPAYSTSLTTAFLYDILNDLEKESYSTLLTLTSISSALINNANAADIGTQVEDTQMIIESMSIEELKELKNSIIDKENTLTLHTK